MPDSRSETLFKENLRRSVILLILAVAAILVCRFMAPAGTAPQAGVLLQLPSTLAGYDVKEGEISEGERVMLPSDTGFARKIYTDARGESLVASIILSGSERRSIHRPEACLPAQGWTIAQRKVVDITMNDGSHLPIMRLRVVKSIRLPNGEPKQLVSYVFYYFIGKDIVTPYHWTRVWVTSYDRVVHRLNHRWAYVLMQELVTEGLKPGGLSEEGTIQNMEKITREIVPTFMLVDLKKAQSN